MQPGRWGWVQLDLPTELPDTLLLGTLAAKSEWHDNDAGMTFRNGDAIKQFAQVSKVIQQPLKGPMWVRNTKTGASGMYRNFCYSEGAKQWLDRGGKLGQEGVANNEYLVSDPADKLTDSRTKGSTAHDGN